VLGENTSLAGTKFGRGGTTSLWVKSVLNDKGIRGAEEVIQICVKGGPRVVPRKKAMRFRLMRHPLG